MKAQCLFTGIARTVVISLIVAQYTVLYIGDNMLELVSLCWVKQLHLISAEISDKFVNYKTCTFC